MSTLTQVQTYRVAWANVVIEEATLAIKTLSCTGSFLKGYHVKEAEFPFAGEIDEQVQKIEEALKAIKGAIKCT